MVGQPFHLLGRAVPSACLQRCNNTRVQPPPSRSQEASVGDLVRQGVLEGVCSLREEACLIQELRGLERGEMAVELGVWQVGSGSQQRAWDLHANDGSGLQQA